MLDTIDITLQREGAAKIREVMNLFADAVESGEFAQRTETHSYMHLRDAEGDSYGIASVRKAKPMAKDVRIEKGAVLTENMTLGTYLERHGKKAAK